MDEYRQKMAEACMDELLKIAQQEKNAISAGLAKVLGVAGLGAAAYHFGRKAKQDYQMGKQMRQQQGY
jgi:uncharacterized protein HemX